jgi:hypothetical protein
MLHRLCRGGDRCSMVHGPTWRLSITTESTLFRNFSPLQKMAPPHRPIELTPPSPTHLILWLLRRIFTGIGFSQMVYAVLCMYLNIFNARGNRENVQLPMFNTENSCLLVCRIFWYLTVYTLHTLSLEPEVLGILRMARCKLSGMRWSELLATQTVG